MQKYLFYRASPDGCAVPQTELATDYYTQIWVPKIHSIAPNGLLSSTFFAWWLFHWFKVFKSKDYRACLVFAKDNLLAHSTVLLPAHFRFPFMRDNDVQIGPVDTKDNHRRKGLSLYSIFNILKEYENKDVRFWYITRAENIASIKLIESANFGKVGEGKKIINKYNRLLSYFDIDVYY